MGISLTVVRGWGVLSKPQSYGGLKWHLTVWRLPAPHKLKLRWCWEPNMDANLTMTLTGGGERLRQMTLRWGYPEIPAGRYVISAHQSATQPRDLPTSMRMPGECSGREQYRTRAV
ncbi:hypothetical protein NDU88_002273 [Pleurodeles waltl]|uniref:Uncharacterized protein n=1 Tax=Pleurodeles waltl TaxID=8319 RepID=A0AAV7SC24_PLEWA|nr:hypothetical protein NDU88_002273 [Pleurodeles waltl]